VATRICKLPDWGTNLLTKDKIRSGVDTGRKTISFAMLEKNKFNLSLDSSCTTKFP
jgi:hypothetical protein